MAEEKLHRHHSLFGGHRSKAEEEEEQIVDDTPFDSYASGGDYSKKISADEDRDFIHDEADEDYEQGNVEHKHTEHPDNLGSALGHDTLDSQKTTVCSDCDHKHKEEGKFSAAISKSKEEEEEEEEADESSGEKKHHSFERD